MEEKLYGVMIIDVVVKPMDGVSTASMMPTMKDPPNQVAAGQTQNTLEQMKTLLPNPPVEQHFNLLLYQTRVVTYSLFYHSSVPSNAP